MDLHNHHDHSHHHHEGNSNIAFAFWINIFFALLEIAGGLYTNSVAILSDALHDLGDSLTLGTAWFFEKKAKQKRDARYTYGYKRFSLVGAIINAVVLVVGSIFIVIEAVQRLFIPAQPDTTGMIVFALLGIVVNGVAMLRLKRGGSLNEKMISLHFLEDVLGWVAVLVGSIIMKFFEAPFIDPLLSIVIGLIILYNVYRNIGSVFQIILQGVPDNVNEQQAKEQIEKFDEVEGTHDMHLWTLDGKYNILTTHIVLRKPLTDDALEELKRKIKKSLEDINIQNSTVEFEVKGLAHCEELR